MEHENGKLIFNNREVELTGLDPELSEDLAEFAHQAVERALVELRQRAQETTMSPLSADKGKRGNIERDIFQISRTITQLEWLIVSESMAKDFQDYLKGQD